jgi:hypothetical protein
MSSHATTHLHSSLTTADLLGAGQHQVFHDRNGILHNQPSFILRPTSTSASVHTPLHHLRTSGGALLHNGALLVTGAAP